MALVFVKEQHHDLCLAAVQQNGLVLHLVKQQNHDLCLAVVEQNGLALKHS